jgi:uncharacterized repeat protein (TIGR01451 family)
VLGNYSITYNTANFTITQAASADLAISISDGQASVGQGQAITYTVIVTNSGPATVINASVVNVIPTSVLTVTWTCTATTGGCATGSGSGNIINTDVTLLTNGRATFIVQGTVAASTTSGTSLTATASVTAPSGVTDPDSSNNLASDTTTVIIIPVTGGGKLYLPLILH